MKDRVHLTDEQIKKITYHIQSLSEQERDAVRAVLYRLKSSGIGRAELRAELVKLRKSYAISDIDMDAILEALFSE